MSFILATLLAATVAGTVAPTTAPDAAPARAQTATPTPAPIARTPRTLADVAHDRKLGIKGTPGTFSVAGGDPTPITPSMDRMIRDAVDAQSAEVAAAEKEQDRAVRDGVWTRANIHYNEAIKDSARSAWDNAAETCRRTVGCTPVYRPKEKWPIQTGATSTQRGYNSYEPPTEK